MTEIEAIGEMSKILFEFDSRTRKRILNFVIDKSNNKPKPEPYMDDVFFYMSNIK